jgi:phage protein D
MPSSLIFNARPQLLVDGSENSLLGATLREFTIVDRLGEPCRCMASFDNWGASGSGTGYLYSDRQVLDFGKPFAVQFDDENIFEGRISGLEAIFSDTNVPSFSVTAIDRLNDLCMVRRTRTFEDMSEGDLLHHIASDHGLGAQANFSGSTHKLLAQLNQTDFAFLSECLQRAGALLWIEGSTLHAARERGSAANAHELALAGNLHEFAVKADLAMQRTSLKVTGWNIDGKHAIAHEAQENALAGLSLAGPSGPALVSHVHGERKDSIVDAVVRTSEDARQLAESAYQRMARHFMVGRGIADTNARLQTGAYVEITHVDSFATGVYLLTEIKHVFDAVRGLRTEFTAERASLGPV